MTFKTRMTSLFTFILLSACTSTTLLQSEQVSSPGEYFEFHIDPWVSLHHFAYHYAREQASNLRVRGRVPLTEEDRSDISPEFEQSCRALLPAYEPFLEKSLLHDESTRSLVEELTKGHENLTNRRVREALVECMPAYQVALWPRHRKSAETMLSNLLLELEDYEAGMVLKLAELLQEPWSKVAVRVDIAPYANWAGAYTDDNPPHITMSSSDRAIGAHAFEMLFHEAMHTGALGASIDQLAHDALRYANIKSDTFWHYLLFFLTGKATVKVTGDPDYIMYADAVGLTQRQHAAPFYEALANVWEMDLPLRDRVFEAAMQVAGE